MVLYFKVTRSWSYVYKKCVRLEAWREEEKEGKKERKEKKDPAWKEENCLDV